LKIEKKHQFEGHEGAIYALAYNSLTNKVFSGGFDNIVVEWSIENPKDFAAIAKLPSKTISLKFIPDFNWLLTGQSNGDVHILDLNKKEEIHILRVHTDMIFSICYHEDSGCFYIGSGDGFISVWHISSMSLLRKVNISSKKIRALTFIEGHLYIGCGDGSVKVVNVTSFEVIDVLEDHMIDFSVNCIANATDNRILTGSRDGHLNVYSLIEGVRTLVNRIPAHNYAIYDIAFSNDRRYFATASRDKSIKIWDAQTFDFIKKIDYVNSKGHTASVNAVLWLNEKLVTTGDDRKIIVWDI